MAQEGKQGHQGGRESIPLTLVINAIPQWHIEAVIAATLCPNLVHVTWQRKGGTVTAHKDQL